jgi:hypothetical protein
MWCLFLNETWKKRVQPIPVGSWFFDMFWYVLMSSRGAYRHTCLFHGDCCDSDMLRFISMATAAFHTPRKVPDNSKSLSRSSRRWNMKLSNMKSKWSKTGKCGVYSYMFSM